MWPLSAALDFGEIE
jgi:hypothetical protein